MNILYVSSKKGWGGVASWMLRTALALERRGHKVWIISHPCSRITASLPEGIRLVPKRLGMDYNPFMILYIIGFIKRKGIDLIVTNIQKEITVAAPAAKICRVPNLRRIGNEHDISDRFRWHQEHLVDHTICPSKSVLERAARSVDWLDTRKYTVIYNGRNPVTYSEKDILDQRRRWGLSGHDFVIGCTAQLAAVKGIDGLMRAFKAIIGAGADAYLVLTGEGREEENLKALADRIGISGRVVFAGFSEEPARAAAAYDIGVLNSSSEGLPNTLIEYMAVGTAVVSTDVGGVAEVIKHRQNGLLVRAGDDEGLQSAISEVMLDRELRLRLGREGQKTVGMSFSEDIMIDKLESLLQEMAGRRGA